MPNHEGLIRYLMKEMDPSEEVEFERSMMEDEDLLIEVESLRKTLQKTQALPQIHPPHHITESVLNQAKEYRSKQLLSTRIKELPYINYAAAAVVIIALGIGYSFTQWNSSDVPLSSASVNSIDQSSSDVKPWVDKNNILKVADGYNSNGNRQSMYMDGEWAKNGAKLIQVNATSNGFREVPKNIQLTGSSN